MSKRQKRLDKLRQNPTNVSFDEIRRALEAEGFELDHATGSHHVFRVVAGDKVLTVVIPFARPVKPVYVKAALDAIDVLRQAVQTKTEEDDDESDES